MEIKQEKRIIVIGSEGHYGVKTALWTSSEMPNLADYDNVVLDVSSLSYLLEERQKDASSEQRERFYYSIREKLKYVKDRLVHILHSKGNIYAVCSPYVSWKAIHNYDWAPFRIDLADEKGETIKVVENSFAGYIQLVKRWSFCFEKTETVESEIDDFYEGKYYAKPVWEVIAENRYGKSLAVSVSYALYERIHISGIAKALASRLDGQVLDHKSEAERISGKLVLLPVPTEIDVREGINFLLEDLWGIQQKTPPPVGIDKILVPGEGLLKQEIQDKVENIEGLKSKISGLEIRKEEVAQFKQLLYETGTPLENICKLTLRKLGCDIDDSVEDFILIKGNKEAIVEVKGREATIERKDGAQLAQNRRNHAISIGKGMKEVKAILLGNPWRLLFPLEERVQKEPFSPHLGDDAKTEDMTLVTTVELFEAYCSFLEGKISSDEIINRLFSVNGVAKLADKEQT